MKIINFILFTIIDYSQTIYRCLLVPYIFLVALPKGYSNILILKKKAKSLDKNNKKI